MAYELRPGNMPDTKTISDVKALCDEFEILQEKVWTVVDRNCSSAENLADCSALDMTTIAAVSMSRKYVAEVRDRRVKELMSNRTYIVAFRLHGLSEKVMLSNGTEVTLCLFQKAKLREKARQSLMAGIEQFKATWKNGKGKDKINKELKKFFSPLEEGKPAVENWDAIDTEIEKRGLFALVCTSPMSCWQALRGYKTRNCVEVAFKAGKQHVNLESVRVHRDLALQGKMFVNFIELMLIAAVQKRLHFWKMTPNESVTPINRNLSYSKLLDKMKCARLVKDYSGVIRMEGVTGTIENITEQMRLSDVFDIQKSKERLFKL